MQFIKQVLSDSPYPVEDFKIRRISVYPKEFKSTNDIGIAYGPHRPNSQTFVPFQNEAVQFWKVFFDFAYYTLLTPFRFVWHPITGSYICRTNKFQRGLQWILCLFTTSYFLSKVHQMSKLDPDENPTLYFDLAYYFFDTTFLVVLFLTFGRCASLVNEVFENLQSENKNFYRDARNYRKTRRLTALICVGCLSTLGMQVLETLSDQEWSFSAFKQFWEDDAEKMFHMKALTDICPTFFGILSLTSSLFEKLLNAFSDILFTMTVLMFDTLVNSFAEEMERSHEFENPMRILEHYWWLKYITDKINSAMNLIIGAFVAGNLPFYATNVFEVFGDANIFMRLRYMFYCSYWFPSLFIAANANYKLEKVKEWVCKEENYSRVPPVKLSVFLHEISFHTIGVCSYGILTVTWNSVGSIISIIMTYALLKSQFKQGPHKEDPAEILETLLNNAKPLPNF